MEMDFVIFSNTKKKVMYRTFVTNDYPPVAHGVGEGMSGRVGEGWFHEYNEKRCKDMYNNDVGKGGVWVDEAHEVV